MVGCSGGGAPRRRPDGGPLTGTAAYAPSVLRSSSSNRSGILSAMVILCHLPYHHANFTNGSELLSITGPGRRRGQGPRRASFLATGLTVARKGGARTQAGEGPLFRPVSNPTRSAGAEVPGKRPSGANAHPDRARDRRTTGTRPHPRGLSAAPEDAGEAARLLWGVRPGNDGR